MGGDHGIPTHLQGGDDFPRILDGDRLTQVGRRLGVCYEREDESRPQQYFSVV